MIYLREFYSAPTPVVERGRQYLRKNVHHITIGRRAPFYRYRVFIGLQGMASAGSARLVRLDWILE